ncbi:flagellar basal body-associated FliL family protein [Breoghania sp.]|uniref:flagellar basal body-associated FliL family protein n=1 Tax=Breoghania sp. TaxID=2065378 RepID=UPI002AA7B7F7|nr:flagellar basal body-associated FliL family protein [Breoghania sp.]
MTDLTFPAETGGRMESSKSERSLVPVILLLTLLAVGAGALAGMNLVDQTRLAVLKTERQSHSLGIEPLYKSVGHIQAINPVVANLAEPKDVFVRIQGTVVFQKDDVVDAPVLVSKIESDISAYIRTLTLADIEGAGGLRHLREDLNQRAQIRTDGKVNEFILETMVVQ